MICQCGWPFVNPESWRNDRRRVRSAFFATRTLRRRRGFFVRAGGRRAGFLDAPDAAQRRHAVAQRERDNERKRRGADHGLGVGREQEPGHHQGGNPQALVPALAPVTAEDPATLLRMTRSARWADFVRGAYNVVDGRPTTSEDPDQFIDRYHRALSEFMIGTRQPAVGVLSVWPALRAPARKPGGGAR